MNHPKVNEVLAVIATDLGRTGHTPIRHATDETTSSMSKLLNHCLWMSIEAQQYEFPKAMRWLGCIQGIMFATGYKTIDELKATNKPKET
jgi:hypothetical protein